jgi:hypothetical protein
MLGGGLGDGWKQFSITSSHVSLIPGASNLGPFATIVRRSEGDDHSCKRKSETLRSPHLSSCDV